MSRKFFATKNTLKVSLFAFLLLICAGIARAQSLDQAQPSPLRSNSLTAKIAARDLGDARLTDHYYAFTGTPGDLLITIQSRNLNGDLDVFTAGTLRPLLKLSLYAENTLPVTKGIYLRKREALILRIEARSPNDDDGSYQLFFGGSFEPIIGGPELAETDPNSSESTGSSSGVRKAKRVSSVGARINEPEPPVTEVTATPTPEPTAEAKPEEAKPKEKSAEVEPPKTTPVRSARNRRLPIRRTTPGTTPRTTTKAEEKKEETTTETTTAESSETEVKPKTTGRPNTRRGSTVARSTPKPAPEPEAETGPRLIIETNDGTLINRSMSGVRRVTVENGQVVVTGKDGKIDRVLLTNVVRMSIAP